MFYCFHRSVLSKLYTIYAKLGQFDYGKDESIKNLHEIIVTSKYGNKNIYIGQVKEGTEIKEGIGIQVFSHGDTEDYNYVFVRESGRIIK